MIVWQMLAALGLGGILGAGGVSGWMRWRATRVPALRVNYRRVSGRDMRRLATAFDLRRPSDPMRVEPPPVHTLGGERGSSADGRVRYTYVRGPVRGRDHDPT